MRAVERYKANDIRVEKREVKEVLTNEVIVRVVWTGIYFKLVVRTVTTREVVVFLYVYTYTFTGRFESQR